MIGAHALFWGCLGTLVYAYVLYPAALRLATRRRKERPPTAAEAPTVSVIVAAHNEARCIGAKIQNLLEQEYPQDRLEIIVVDDGSTDGTAELVSAMRHARVQLIQQPARQGKNAALDAGARAARGDILVSTDANAMLGPGALRRLVDPFEDRAVGLVSGQGLYGELGDGTARVVSNAYVRYEAFLRKGEAGLGFLAGADGALYALRRSLYRPLPADQVHDLIHPIEVALGGGRSAFVPEAFTVEPPSPHARREFQRHVRIIAQGLRVFVRQAPGLLRQGRLGPLWMLTSHRLLRWAGSALLGGAVAGNVALLGSHPIYTVTLVAQCAFYGLALAGAIAERAGMRLRLFAIPYYFCVVNAAGAMAFLEFAGGRAHLVWDVAGGAR